MYKAIGTISVLLNLLSMELYLLQNRDLGALQDFVTTPWLLKTIITKMTALHPNCCS